MDRRKFLKIAVTTGTALSAAPLLDGCGTTASPSPSPGLKVGNHPQAAVHLGDTVTPPNPEYQAEQYFANRLQELTNDEYSVILHPNSELGTAQAMNDLLKAGTALQFVKCNTGQMNNILPAIDAWNLPYAFVDPIKLKNAEHGPMGQKTDELLQAGPGLKVLGWFDGGTRNVFSKIRPIKEPADISGLKIRVTSATSPLAQLFTGLGATAVPVGTSAIYGAFQSGQIDSAENNVPFFVTNHLDEVSKYFSYTKHSYSIDPLMVSLAWFNSQPTDLQAAIIQAATDTEAQERTLWAAGEITYKKQAVTDQGIIFNDTDVDIAAFKTSQPVKDAWAKGPTYGDLFTLLQSAQ
ncbi:MAG TPA: TRAP transporter substrate-binding protein DctP [Candidatus Dormibacteraeota bacterium]|jgi:tripartite ATP-independent transporter DctP family solute receptor|nr:TRAP transporter substrate-binding protein DctP [Candidatus Dormibacteraeota bacterium]